MKLRVRVEVDGAKGPTFYLARAILILIRYIVNRHSFELHQDHKQLKVKTIREHSSTETQRALRRPRKTMGLERYITSVSPLVLRNEAFPSFTD